jgi:hypothetical protein
VETFCRRLHGARHSFYGLGRDFENRYEALIEAPQDVFVSVIDMFRQSALEMFNKHQLPEKRSENLHSHASYNAPECDAIIYQVLYTATELMNKVKM